MRYFELGISIRVSTVEEGLVSGSGGNPFLSHSLSWSRKSDISPNGTMYAKVWTPEDPRANKNVGVIGPGGGGNTFVE